MTRTMSSKIQPILVLFLAFAAISPPASAQITSGATSLTLSAILPESIGISGSASGFTWNTNTLVAGRSITADAPVTMTTTWALSSVGRSGIEVDAYFATPAHALSDGLGHYIPSSAVFAAVSGTDTLPSSPMTANTATGPAAGGLVLFSHTLSTDFSASRSDTLTLAINLAGTAIPPGTYTGTLTLQAQSF